MKLTVLDGHALNPGDLSWDIFKDFADVKVYERTSPTELVERIGDSDAIFLNKINITEEVLSRVSSNSKNLKYIGVLATGYNVIDLEATRNHNIIVTNIPAYSTESVAQHTFSLITYFTNHVALHNNSVKNGDWINNPDFCYWKNPLIELNSKTLGIFGYGNIGKKVAEIGKAFGMKVICCSKTKKEGIENVSWENLLKYSDFLSLHAPLTEETKGIINENSLALMKPTAYLINTARGGFIVEEDLAKYLKANLIAGYAADVISEEPMKKENPLFNCPNCVLTPHTAWAPLETRTRLLNIAYNNLKSWLEGNPINVVN